VFVSWFSFFLRIGYPYGLYQRQSPSKSTITLIDIMKFLIELKMSKESKQQKEKDRYCYKQT
jgi:hypothetical protein